MVNEMKDYHPNIEDLISLRQAAKISGYTTNHLRLLLSRGDLWGFKIDRHWVTTEKAIKVYLAQNPKPGRKSK